MYQSVAGFFFSRFRPLGFVPRPRRGGALRAQPRTPSRAPARAYLILTGATGTIGLVALSWDSDRRANSRDAENKRNSTKDNKQTNMVLL